MEANGQSPNKRWQLRVLNGPSRGATLLLTTGRVSIGRAASSDLHIGSTGVSRQHAHVVEDDSGQHVLVDLASSNGTYVDGEAIERHVLRPNTFFSIFDIDVAYEEAVEVAVVGETPTPVIDARTLRGTAEVRRFEAPTQPHAAGEEIEPSTSPAPSAAKDAEGRPLVFECPDGEEYDGNLLDDIAEYRALRAQHLRGGFAETGLRRQFERLRGRLQQPPSSDPHAAQRAFCRFGCWLPAQVRLADGDEHECRVRDLGVDGAQLIVGDHELERDAIVWLTIEVSEGESASRSILFAGRVAWVDDEFLGIQFSGSPPRIQGRYAGRPSRAHQDALDQRPLRLVTRRGSATPEPGPT